MIQFMRDKMDEIYNDFKDNLAKEDKYCKLKQFKFNSSNIPDYNEEIIQQYYLLRYIPAYLVEYYKIYEDALNKEFLDDKLNVLSVGCGAGIDLVAAHYVMKSSKNNIKLRYTGLDIVNWNYWEDCDEEAYFIKDNICNLSKLDEEEYNVIIFPKSIGEFSVDEFNNLKSCISNTNFISDKIMIIASMRNTRVFSDIDRVKGIINEIKNKGYTSLDNVNQYTYCKKKINGYDYRTNDIIQGFEYPEEIKDFMTRFHTNCQGYIDNGDECCGDECKDTFERKVLTTMSQVAYVIIRLERRE